MKHISTLSRLLGLLLVLLIVAACIPGSLSEVGDLSILTTATIPASASVEDICIDSELEFR